MAKKANNKNKHTIVQLSKSDIKILIPDGYTKLKQKNPLNEIQRALKNETVAFRKIVDYSDGFVFVDKLLPEKELPSNEKDLIDGIHECLSEEQGLIEVGSGYTKRGYRYIYSIVKTLDKEIRGSKYHLYMQLFNDGKRYDAVAVSGDFAEINMTGMRDSFGYELAMRVGLVDFKNDDSFEGWNSDPYDPEYKKGALMNLSEKPGLDGLFPFHPLSQCRELLKALINDQLVIIKKEDDSNDSLEKDETKENVNTNEFILKLFNNETDRITYSVEL